MKLQQKLIGLQWEPKNICYCSGNRMRLAWVPGRFAGDLVPWPWNLGACVGMFGIGFSDGLPLAIIMAPYPSGSRACLTRGESTRAACL